MLVEYVRHEARLEKLENGFSVRVHYEGLARRGVASAIKMLEPRPFPDVLSGLWERFQFLAAMRGEGLNGAAPISLSDIRAGNELLDWNLKPREVIAIRQLDHATRHPEADEEGSE